MEIDWGYAAQIGGIGFGTVFLVLVILAVVITIVGLATRRIERNKNKETVKGE
jgi:Na+-transporting methylmalonyl-CoA/oxaloacetate decarboxylase gamma subunit